MRPPDFLSGPGWWSFPLNPGRKLDKTTGHLQHLSAKEINRRMEKAINTDNDGNFKAVIGPGDKKRWALIS